jgi:hypothetical protein
MHYALELFDHESSWFERAENPFAAVLGMNYHSCVRNGSCVQSPLRRNEVHTRE